MVQRLGSISSGESIVIPNTVRYEHHKVYYKVTNLVSNVVVRLVDSTIKKALGSTSEDDEVTLSCDGDREFDADGVYSDLLTNARVEELEVKFISGDATVSVFYTGW